MSHIRVQHTRHHHSRAFTLIELLVVISIIGLLSSVVLAAVNGARQKGTMAAGQKFDQHTHSAFYDDLVLSWDFDNDSGGTVLDQSGNGNSMTYSGASGPSTQQNPFNKGKSFFIDRTSSPPASTGALKNPPTGNFSVSFWLYPTDTTAIDFISNFGTLIGEWRFSNKDTGSGFFFDVRTTTQVRSASLGKPQVNQWHHIAGVCTGGNKLTIYINGRVAAQSTAFLVSEACANAGSPSTAAVQVGSGLDPFGIYIDNVRVYEKALLASTVQDIYLAELPQFEALAQHRVMK